MSAFITADNGEYVYEVQRSKFIGLCRRVESDEQAAEVVANIRRRYGDCTHVCYAYLTEESSRSCDDGEPSGTAGMPIMECIRTAKLCNTLVAVVRYFGGIKLGAGGLVRAYTHTAAETLCVAHKTEVADCALYSVRLDYAVWKKIEKRRVQSLYKLIGMEYNKTVDVRCAATDGDAFEREWQALTQGKCEIVPLGNGRAERDAT